MLSCCQSATQQPRSVYHNNIAFAIGKALLHKHLVFGSRQPASCMQVVSMISTQSVRPFCCNNGRVFRLNVILGTAAELPARTESGHSAARRE